MKILMMMRTMNCKMEFRNSYLQDLYSMTGMYLTINTEKYSDVFHAWGIIATLYTLKNYFWPATIHPAGSMNTHFFTKNGFFESDQSSLDKKNENEKKNKKNKNEKKVKKDTKTKKSLKNVNEKKKFKNTKTKKNLKKKKKEEKKFKNEKNLKNPKLLSSSENFLKTKCRKRRNRRRSGRRRRKSRMELLLLLVEMRLLTQGTETGAGTYTGRLDEVQDCTVLDCTVQYSTVQAECLGWQVPNRGSLEHWDILDKKVQKTKQVPDSRTKGGG